MIICKRGFGADLFPCLPTDWPLSRAGYGFRTRTELAHVVALEEKLGRPLAMGKQANHHCDNRACVLEAHLYEGTQSQNIRDMWDRGRGYSAFANGVLGTPRVTSPEEEDAIRRRYAAGDVTMRQLAGELGISKATVCRIVQGRTPPKPRKRLSVEQREEIRRRYKAGGVTRQELAGEYGASIATIGNVITRRFQDPAA